MALLDGLQENKAKLNAHIPQALLDKEADLQADLLYYQREIKQIESQLRTLIDEAEKETQNLYLAEMQTKYFECNENLQAILQEITHHHPEYKNIKHKNKTITIEQLQVILAPNQALVNYFIVNPIENRIPLPNNEETSIFIFCITKDSFHIYRQKAADNFAKQINDFLKTINRLRYKKYIQIAHELYQLLVSPIVAQLQANQITDLLIIPHEQLNRIPFEALLTNNAQAIPNGQYPALPYLLQQYNISYHYSTRFFYESHLSSTTPLEESDGFVGFAPVYTEKAPNTEDKPPTAASTSTAQSTQAVPSMLPSPMTLRGATRDVKIGGETYAALIFSEQEIKAVENLFNQNNISTQSFLHEQATIEQFKQAVKDKKYIHIAAHGYDHELEKELTGILFSPDENTQKITDSILYLSDTYGLKLSADLVVLSSCKSGIGRLAEGEGMLAMNRGFLHAGAKNVVYTLFKVYDQASSELTQHFFEQILTHSQGYAKALQAAKRQLIAKEGYTPKHWAGFVLIGW